jgi:hypothetical protein
VLKICHIAKPFPVSSKQTDPTMTEKQLTEIYLQNKTRFDFAIDFISSNKHLKTNVDISFNANVLINKESAKEKIRLLFIDTLNAAGGSNLTRNGKASRYFNSKIETLENSAQLKIKDFYECFWINNIVICILGRHRNQR